MLLFTLLVALVPPPIPSPVPPPPPKKWISSQLQAVFFWWHVFKTGALTCNGWKKGEFEKLTLELFNSLMFGNLRGDNQLYFAADDFPSAIWSSCDAVSLVKDHHAAFQTAVWDSCRIPFSCTDGHLWVFLFVSSLFPLCLCFVFAYINQLYQKGDK